MVVHACNPSTREAEVGGSWVQDKWLPSEHEALNSNTSPTTKKKRKKKKKASLGYIVKPCLKKTFFFF
jgi:hypothetical protein